ncbi:MAG: POTRA domain-containing protein [Planctomycetota bacterium]
MIPAICLMIVCGDTPTACGQSGTAGPMGGGQQMQPEPKPLKRVPTFGPQERIPVKDVKFEGLERVPQGRVETMVQTRPQRVYDPQVVQDDVRRLIQSRLFRDVRTFRQKMDDGIIITFQLFERPLVQHVKFAGNDRLKDKALIKEVGFKKGDPLNRFAVEEGQRRLERLYEDKGFQGTSITIREGTAPTDIGVTYEIREGVVTRLTSTTFEGNNIASDARLKTLIDNKPGIVWLIGGKLSEDGLAQDIDKLTAYYRNLGFFRASIRHEVAYNEERTWAKLKFLIDEGPRYRVRSIQIQGNQQFETDRLLAKMETQEGDFVSLSRMQRDLSVLRDEYGSRGFIFADIEAKPRFDEQPGQLDIVYDITEGQQYRVGRIFVNIDGQQSHTRRNVVLNRLSIQPGDLVDVREIRKSERRLGQSQLFEINPTQGTPPKIVVKPPEDETQVAGAPVTRGQSPDPSAARPQRAAAPTAPHQVRRPVVDLEARVTLKQREGSP